MYIVRKLLIRSLALVLYVIDIPILFYTVSYIFTYLLLRNILRNITLRVTIGHSILLVLLLTVILISLYILKWKVKKVCNRKRVGWQIVLFTEVGLKALIPALLCVIIVAFGEYRERKNNGYTRRFTNCCTSLPVEIIDEPVPKTPEQELKCKILQGRVPVGFKILIKTPNFIEYNIGDICSITGKADLPQNNPNSRYKDILNNKNLYLIFKNPEISCRKDLTKLNIRRSLVDFKKKIIKIVDNKLPEPQSSLLIGILLGERRLFSKEFTINLQINGVNHIVAASGYNITIIIITFSKILGFLPKRSRHILNISLAWLFSILSGLSPSIIRACIMASVVEISQIFGRRSNIHMTILLTTLIFLFFDRKILSNIGYQLSVSATLGLVYILPILTTLRKKLFPKANILDEYLLPTMSCTISTLPVTIYTFKTVTIWAIFSNALILPVIQSTMIFGSLAILLHGLSENISTYLFAVVTMQLKYFEMIVMNIAKIPFGYWQLSDKLSTILTIILIVLIIFMVISYYPIKNEKYNYYLKTIKTGS